MFSPKLKLNMGIFHGLLLCFSILFTMAVMIGWLVETSSLVVNTAVQMMTVKAME